MKTINLCMSRCSLFGPLVLRLTLGAIFLFHGIAKLSNMEGTIAFFGSIGLAVFWTWIVAIIEIIAGILMIIGIWTRYSALLLSIIMIVAIIIKISSGNGFQAMELDVVLLGLSIGVGLLGCGQYSMCCSGHRKACSDESCVADCGCHCKK